MKRTSLCLGLLLATTSAFAWEHVKDVDGLSVYQQRDEASGYNAVRIQATLPFPMAKLVAMNADAATLSEWMETFTHVDLIEKTQWYSYSIHAFLDFPFPYAARDSVTHSEWRRQADGSVTLDFKEIEGVVPADPDYIRMPIVRGRWTFVPTSDTETLTTYESLATPGGDGPAWVINAFAVDVPVKTMQNLVSYAPQFDKPLPDLSELPAAQN